MDTRRTGQYTSCLPCGIRRLKIWYSHVCYALHLWHSSFVILSSAFQSFGFCWCAYLVFSLFHVTTSIKLSTTGTVSYRANDRDPPYAPFTLSATAAVIGLKAAAKLLGVWLHKTEITACSRGHKRRRRAVRLNRGYTQTMGGREPAATDGGDVHVTGFQNLLRIVLAATLSATCVRGRLPRVPARDASLLLEKKVEGVASNWLLSMPTCRAVVKETR